MWGGDANRCSTNYAMLKSYSVFLCCPLLARLYKNILLHRARRRPAKAMRRGCGLDTLACETGNPWQCSGLDLGIVTIHQMDCNGVCVCVTMFSAPRFMKVGRA